MARDTPTRTAAGIFNPTGSNDGSQLRGCSAPANRRVNLQVYYQHAPPAPPSPPSPPPSPPSPPPAASSPPSTPHQVYTLSGPEVSMATWIRSTQATTVQPLASSHVIWWDGNSQDESNRDYVLLWFNLTGVPADRIAAAQLTYQAAGSGNSQGNMGELHELLLPWDMQTTYSSLPYTPNDQRGGESVTYGPAVHNMICSAGFHTVDVTNSVTSWASDAAPNNGFIVVPSFSDGCGIQSQFSTTGPPTLTIDVRSSSPPPSPPPPPPSPPPPPPPSPRPPNTPGGDTVPTVVFDMTIAASGFVEADYIQSVATFLHGVSPADVSVSTSTMSGRRLSEAMMIVTTTIIAGSDTAAVQISNVLSSAIDAGTLATSLDEPGAVFSAPTISATTVFYPPPSPSTMPANISLAITPSDSDDDTALYAIIAVIGSIVCILIIAIVCVIRMNSRRRVTTTVKTVAVTTIENPVSATSTTAGGVEMDDKI